MAKLRADAADADELLEHLLFFCALRIRRARWRLRGHGCGCEANLARPRWEARKRGDRDGDVIAHAADVNDGLVGAFLGKRAAQQGDHLCDHSDDGTQALLRR